MKTIEKNPIVLGICSGNARSMQDIPIIIKILVRACPIAIFFNQNLPLPELFLSILPRMNPCSNQNDIYDL